LGHAGRIFNSFLIFFGVSAMFVAVGAMTQTIIEFQLKDTLESAGKNGRLCR
jgi:voltage-gated potassium channel